MTSKIKIRLDSHRHLRSLFKPRHYLIKEKGENILFTGSGGSGVGTAFNNFVFEYNETYHNKMIYFNFENSKYSLPELNNYFYDKKTQTLINFHNNDSIDIPKIIFEEMTNEDIFYINQDQLFNYLHNQQYFKLDNFNFNQLLILTQLLIYH